MPGAENLTRDQSNDTGLERDGSESMKGGRKSRPPSDRIDSRAPKSERGDCSALRSHRRGRLRVHVMHVVSRFPCPMIGRVVFAADVSPM